MAIDHHPTFPMHRQYVSAGDPRTRLLSIRSLTVVNSLAAWWRDGTKGQKRSRKKKFGCRHRSRQKTSRSSLGSCIFNSVEPTLRA